MKNRKYCKIRDHCHYTGEYRCALHSIFLDKNIPIVFHNGSNHDYQFIIKELNKNCFGENTEKYVTFTFPIDKEVKRIDKNGEEIAKNLFYILQFIDSAKFKASSLSNLVNNLSEGLHIIKCKLGHGDKKNEKCGIKWKYCDCFLEYANFKYELIECKCSICNNNCQIKFHEKLKKRFFNKSKFSNRDNNLFYHYK